MTLMRRIYLRMYIDPIPTNILMSLKSVMETLFKQTYFAIDKDAKKIKKQGKVYI